MGEMSFISRPDGTFRVQMGYTLPSPALPGPNIPEIHPYAA